MISLLDVFARLAPGTDSATVSMRVHKLSTGKFSILFTAALEGINLSATSLEGLVKQCDSHQRLQLEAAERFLDEAKLLEVA